MKQILFLSLGLLPLASLFGAEKSFEGTVTTTETHGGVTTQFLFTRKGDQLRIEKTDQSKPEPINIVDLAAQKLTIVYPHNSSFVVVDLARTPSGAGVDDPGGRRPDGSMPVGPGSTIPATVGPVISPPPGFPTPPQVLSMPARPNNPMASGAAHMPMPPPQGFGAPGMPPMPPAGGFRAPVELKKTDKTKKIQGLDCTLYTLSDRGETFEIWAASDAALFPIRMPRVNYQSRHFGPVMLQEQWIELLRNQSLFPLEATLHIDLRAPPAGAPRASHQNGVPEADQSQERYSFKVDQIERMKVDNEKLFQPPEGYFEIQSPTL